MRKERFDILVKKAFFFDLDGTLATQDQPPSQADADAIKAIREQGHLAFLCTGRVPCHVYDSIKAIGFDGFIEGAGAFVSVGENVLYRRLIEPAFLQRIITHYLENGQTCVLEGEQSLYIINPKADWTKKWPIVEGANAFDPINGAYAGQEVYKFTAYGTILEETRKLLEPEMYIIDHMAYAEVLPCGCCKADGMRRVLEAVGLNRTDSVAFGDSRNDLDMLRYAGIGIAMGNAVEDVRLAADRITAPLCENGVSQALAEFIIHK